MAAEDALGFGYEHSCLSGSFVGAAKVGSLAGDREMLRMMGWKTRTTIERASEALIYLNQSQTLRFCETHGSLERAGASGQGEMAVVRRSFVKRLGVA